MVRILTCYLWAAETDPCLFVCPADVSMFAGSGSVDQRLSEHRPDADGPHKVSPDRPTSHIFITLYPESD